MNPTYVPDGGMVPLTRSYRGPSLPKRDRVSLASDPLPPIDFICFLFAFGDLPPGVTDGFTWPVGSIDELVELRKRRTIDWILVALPVAEQARLHGIVQRLQLLSIPIALVPGGP